MNERNFSKLLNPFRSNNLVDFTQKSLHPAGLKSLLIMYGFYFIHAAPNAGYEFFLEWFTNDYYVA